MYMYMCFVHTNKTHCYNIATSICITHMSRVRLGVSQEGKHIMLGASEQRSEVARLLAQISEEYEAAQRGLSGVASGVARHSFITARMENMGQLHTELQSIVGNAAIAMIAEELNKQ